MLYEMKAVVLILLSAFVCAAVCKPLEKQSRATCGYDSCPKTDPTKLNVHVVPHSHDDVGWLKTVDQYYYGSRFDYQNAGVQYIIDSVIHALSQNPDRRFIQVETAFFKRWWNNQDDEMQDRVRELVNNGQLEIIGGAWSMNDEAAVHYQSVIDQFTSGLKFINETLGECGRPKIGWQIDPFGHSREMASIFAQLGFAGLFFARLDFRDKSARLSNQTMEMVWRGSANLGTTTDLFTSALYNHYSAPSGYCFDIRCSDDPIIVDEDSADYNYDTRVEGYAAFIQRQAANYKTNNIIITMGDDFQYQNALSYFHNLDLLIKGFDIFNHTFNNKSINVFYSTPSCYLKAVNSEAATEGISFPLKTDDFFPYASDYHAFWTGYFTSRPTSKRFEREGNNLLQVSKQLAVLNGDSGNLTMFEEAMGMMQHHDAITGTEKQHVANDYHRILNNVMVKGIAADGEYILNLLKKGLVNNANLELTSCLLRNMSYCPESNSHNFTTVVYNPLSRTVSHYVRLPVNSTQFAIIGPNDEVVPYQVTPAPANFDYTGKTISKYDLVFLAEDLPAFGMKVYFISNLDTEDKNSTVVPDNSETRFTLGDESFGIQVNSTTGKLSSVTINNVTIAAEQELMYYISSAGDNSEFEKRASGAYIFRPSADSPNATSFTDVVNTTTYKGEFFDEIQQTFSNWAKQVIRVYKDESYIEFDWIVGPIDIEDGNGKEVISRFNTSLNSGSVFYTDSNGREMLQRIKDYRPTYNYSSDEEPVASNYYPVTSRIVLKDETAGLELAVLNDRAQGGASLASGELELMVHRRCLYDDAFGVGERLNETEYGVGLVARGQHYLVLGNISINKGQSASLTERDVAQRKLLAPWIFVDEASTREELKTQIDFEFSGLNATLPSNVQILTLEPWDTNKILLRLEHILEASEDPNNGAEVAVHLEGLFKLFSVTSLRETTLGANQWLEDNERLEWSIQDDDADKAQMSKSQRETDDLEITLTPMQIRTFIADVVYV